MQEARAAELYAANGVDLRWDNTLRYTVAVRVAAQSATLLADRNGDDGDRNFAPGLVTDRLDVISQLDLSKGDFGLHASAAAWYDTVYHSRTDNRSDATANAAPVPASRFAPAVRDQHGQQAELSDAFLYGNINLGDVPVSIRAGRQTLLWGESLFYDTNAIASAQAPTDGMKIAMGQDRYSNNVYLPVAQLSLTAQIGPDIDISVYDQFEARASRQNGDGSYFSYTDFLGPGARRLFLSPGQYLLHRRDGSVSADGQYGIALHASLDDLDTGFYVLRYNSRDPQIVTMRDSDAGDPHVAGYYRLVYPKDIVLIGMSASATLGGHTVAGELSWRHDAPLLAGTNWVSPDPGEARYEDYWLGDLLHLQISDVIATGRARLWDSADFSMELAADAVTRLTRAASGLDRFAAKARFLFQPHYFQVLPNLDLTFPIGAGYDLAGHGFSYYAQNAGAGDVQVGVSALYRSVWKASLTFTGFVGSPARQPLADRDVVTLSLERTF